MVTTAHDFLAKPAASDICRLTEQYSIRSIASTFGLAVSTVSSWLRRTESESTLTRLRREIEKYKEKVNFYQSVIESSLCSVQSKYELIKAWAKENSVEWMCKTLGVSRSGYYAWVQRGNSGPTTRELRDIQLSEQIIEIFEESEERYGAPRIHAELVARGERVSKKRVARLMKQHGLRATPVRRFVKTTLSDHDRRIAPNILNQDFAVEGVDCAWVSDITYIWTDEGWGYLAVVIDLYSRRVLGWAFAKHMRDTLVLDAFNDALATRGKKSFLGLIFHSDRGSQYASNDFIEALEMRGIERSMSKRGCCWDNAVSESFFASLKKELVHKSRYRTRNEAETALTEYIETFYNPVRRHSYNNYISPIGKEKLA